MPPNFRSEDREQSLLFPPSVNDYLPNDHPARFVRDVVGRLHANGDLDVFYASYREDGRGGKAYHPRVMLSVLLFAYSRGITSARRIQAECIESLAFRFLTANQTPDFRSIADFRKRHIEAFEGLFLGVLKLCEEAGLVELKRTAIDGRRVSGNASIDKTATEETLSEELERLAKEILEEAKRVDAAEDEELGDRTGYELAPEFRTKKGRVKAIDKALAELKTQKEAKEKAHEAKLEQRKRDEEKTGNKKRGPKPKTPDSSKTKRRNPLRVNTTDPESRLMKTRRGFKQGYNGQIVADAKAGVIVACDVTQDANDVRQLVPMLAQVEQNLGRAPKQLIADAGYWSKDNAESTEFTETELFIATKKDSKQRTEGKRAKAPRGRIPSKATTRERMERKLRTKRGQKIYNQRGVIAETPFAHMVNRGFLSFCMRGLRKATGEWKIWSTVVNLLKLRSRARLVLT